MTVHWTNNAIVHLVDIYEYVARDSSIYAKRMVDRITKLLGTDSELSNVGA